jgi:hypothetical protein
VDESVDIGEGAVERRAVVQVARDKLDAEVGEVAGRCRFADQGYDVVTVTS